MVNYLKIDCLLQMLTTPSHADIFICSSQCNPIFWFLTLQCWFRIIIFWCCRFFVYHIVMLVICFTYWDIDFLFEIVWCCFFICHIVTFIFVHHNLMQFFCSSHVTLIFIHNILILISIHYTLILIFVWYIEMLIFICHIMMSIF